MNKLEKISQRIYHIKFDDSAIEKLYAVQNDTKSRSYLFKFQTGSGEMVDFSGITLEMTIQIGEKKQTVMGELVSPEEGTYRVTLPSSALQIAGKARGQLMLIDYENQAKLQTRNFSLTVSPSIEFGGAGEEGQDLWFTFSMLTDAIAETKVLKSEYESSLDEQKTLSADVTEKHSQVTTMHASLAVVFESEESRVTAESQRRTAETERQSSESERQSSETERKISEQERQTAETERKESEINRKSAEVLRDGAEVERIASELGRKQAETARVGAEEGRVTAEEGRATEEVKRVDQYTQTQTLLETLGDTPVVNLSNEITAIKNRGGGRNLLLNSGVVVENDNYLIARYTTSKPHEVGKPYTVTIHGSLGEGKKEYRIYSGIGEDKIVIKKVAEGLYRGTGSFAQSLTGAPSYPIYAMYSNVTATSRIEKIMFEEGTVAHDWSPAPEDLVTKVTGKRLSTNDYTNAEKAKLEGIETGANKYTHPESHEMGMITGLQAMLDGKANSSHTHTVEQVTELQTALDGKVGSTVVKNIVVSTSEDTSGLANGTLLLVVE